MSVPAVLAPVFLQIGLTFVLLFWMGRVRIAAIRAGAVRVADIALAQRAWPDRVTQISNAFHNQFELPVLFYALVAFALFTRKADLLFVAMSWIYVATRLGHAYIQTSSNDIRLRFGVFVIGAVVLLSMWIVFALRILIAPAG